MVDIHNHILPGLDDGPSGLEVAVEMARQAVAQGIEDVIATPHHRSPSYTNSAESVIEQVEAIQAVLRHRKIPLRVHAGQEIRVYPSIIDDFEAGNLLTLGGSRYMLLEFPSDRVSTGIHELIYELQLLQIVPIIAHPERNREIVEDPRKLLELIEAGALAQLTAHSVIGHFGKTIQRFCLDLCRNHMAHFIASDAHNTGSRAFALSEAYDTLRNKLGQDMVIHFQNRAKSLLHDLPLEISSPVWEKPKWFQFWKS
ncbi:tyrosine-protein phosphatase [Paenibacillus aestuarii]|uniref:Tyrosine-protein phosphatase n=1 Tax=Paenibacillus aestuarii TaxID=516965 RepID=A0ABW0K2B3_9BACL|nr:CpsB/CapC family capsule biosynthesis tyrosine phosphatase [Paenibacillus aestuarii]